MTDRFAALTSSIEKCPPNARLQKTTQMLLKLVSHASAFCKAHRIMVQLRRVLMTDVPIGTHGHIDVNQIAYSELDRILVDMEDLDRKTMSQKDTEGSLPRRVSGVHHLDMYHEHAMEHHQKMYATIDSYESRFFKKKIETLAT